MDRVLIVDDDVQLCRLLSQRLGTEGFTIEAVHDGIHGLERALSSEHALVVLDLMLPGMTGLEVCRTVRNLDQTLPIIMATARGDEVDIVVGLEAGADDYVVKPVLARVLDARIRAVLRRAAGAAPGAEGLPKIHTYGELAVDRAGLTVALHGEPIALAPSELRLLLTLTASPGQVFSRQQLLEAVWEHDYHGDARLVDACVKRLRTKMSEPPRAPRYIHTVRGFGYRFAAP